MKNNTLPIFTKEQAFFLHNEMCINVPEFENELYNLFEDEAWKFKCIVDFFLSSSVKNQLRDGCNDNTVYSDMEAYIGKYNFSLSVDKDIEKDLYFHDLFNYFSSYYSGGLRALFVNRQANYNGPRIYLDKKISSDEELKQLPDEITIYRGMSRKEYENCSFGQSWSLNVVVATLFATHNSYTDDTLVVQAVINKSKILLYEQSAEDEIVVKNGTITSGKVIWEKRIDYAPK